MQMQTDNNLNIQISKSENTSAFIGNALDELPHLASLAGYHTGWPVKGNLVIRILNSNEFKIMNETVTRDIYRSHFNEIEEYQLSQKPSSISEDIQKTGENALSFFSRNTSTTPGQIVLNHDKIQHLSAKALESLLVHELIHFSQAQNNPRFFQNMGLLQAAIIKSEYIYGKQDKRTKTLDNTFKDYLYQLESHAQTALSGFKNSQHKTLKGIEAEISVGRARFQTMQSSMFNDSVSLTIKDIQNRKLEKSSLRFINTSIITAVKIWDRLNDMRRSIRFIPESDTQIDLHSAYGLDPSVRLLKQKDLSYDLLNQLASDIINRP